MDLPSRPARPCGRYVFGDYISGNLWSMKLDGTDRQQLASNVIGFIHPSSFGLDSDNNLYVVDIGQGRVFEVTGPSATVPEPTTSALLLVGFGVSGAAMRRRRTRPDDVLV